MRRKAHTSSAPPSVLPIWKPNIALPLVGGGLHPRAPQTSRQHGEVQPWRNSAPNTASLRFRLQLSAVIRKPGRCGLASLGQRLRGCVSHSLLGHRGLWEGSFRGLPTAFRVLPRASAQGHPSLLHFADFFQTVLKVPCGMGLSIEGFSQRPGVHPQPSL